MRAIIFLILAFIGGQNVFAAESMALYAKWTGGNHGRSNWATCNLYSENGVMVNDGKPIEDSVCNISDPIIYSWGCGQIIEVFCYGYTSSGLVVNDGQPTYGKCTKPQPPKSEVCGH